MTTKIIFIDEKNTRIEVILSKGLKPLKIYFPEVILIGPRGKVNFPERTFNLSDLNRLQNIFVHKKEYYTPSS